MLQSKNGGVRTVPTDRSGLQGAIPRVSARELCQGGRGRGQGRGCGRGLGHLPLDSSDDDLFDNEHLFHHEHLHEDTLYSDPE